jgi:transporter family protein
MLNPSIKFALLALVLMGAADTINKWSRQAKIPIGSYLLIQSPFFCLSMLLIALFSTGIKISTIDILYALIGAVISFTAFTLMLHSLTHGSASVNYAIFRLSFVFSSAAAILFLNEILILGKEIGIALAACAIVFFFYNPKQQIVSKKSLIFALSAMIIASCYPLFLKLASRLNTSSPSFLFLMSLFFSGLVVIYNIFSSGFKIPLKTFFYAPLNGILASLATLSLLIALTSGDVSIVAPIYQLSFLITVILSIVLLKEKINVLQITGIIFAAIAILILGLA